jgi:hypothetical protein
MLVLVLALVNCIIGVEAGLRYRVLVVPLLVAIVLPETGLLAIEDEPWSVWRVAGLITSLQIGYLLGSIVRWLPLANAERQVATSHEPVAIEPEPGPMATVGANKRSSQQ